MIKAYNKSDVTNAILEVLRKIEYVQIVPKHTFAEEHTADILKEEVDQVFAKVLEHAGVYDRDEEGKAAMLRFVAYNKLLT